MSRLTDRFVTDRLGRQTAGYGCAARSDDHRPDASPVPHSNPGVLSTILARRHSQAPTYCEGSVVSAGKKIQRTLAPFTLNPLLRFLVLKVWSSLAYAANTAFLGFVYERMLLTAGSAGTGVVSSSDQAYADRVFRYALSQINYILGDAGRSFVGGFGVNSPKLPYHKSSVSHAVYTCDIACRAVCLIVVRRCAVQLDSGVEHSQSAVGRSADRLSVQVNTCF